MRRRLYGSDDANLPINVLVTATANANPGDTAADQASQLIQVEALLQGLNRTGTSSFPDGSGVWHTVGLDITTPQASFIPCQPSCRTINARGEILGFARLQ